MKPAALSAHHAYGVVIGVYYLDKGEKIAWHQHTVPHLVSISKGRAEVEVVGRSPFTMAKGGQMHELPPNIDHEIRGLEDGTVLVNVVRGP